MKENRSFDSSRLTDIEKKRLEFDLAYCDATYDSEEGRDRCYAEARESGAKKEERGR